MTRLHSTLRRSVLATVALSFAATGAAGAEIQPDASSRPAQIEDIGVFRSQFLNIDRAYSDAARVRAAERLAALESAAGSASPETFTLELCAITALADNGHTRCFLPKEDEAQIDFTALDGRFFITSAAPENADLLAAELVAIDDHPVLTVRAALRQLRGGVAAWRDQFVVKVLIRPDLLHTIGLAASSEAAVYRVRTPDGRTIERRVERTKPSTSRATLRSLYKMPWSLQDPDQPFRWRDAPEFDAVVIQLRQNIDSKDQKILDFLVAADAERVRLGRRNVILDMRLNPGGNFLLTRDFMVAWPRKVGPPGRIFVLVGPETFSAGIASTAYLKQAGGDQVILIGAPPGDRLTFFSEGRVVILPHSGIGLLPAPERDDLADGCHAYTDCFVALAQPGSPTGSPQQAGIDRVYGRKPVAVRSLDPDIPARWTIEEYLSGRDPAMEALKRWFTVGSGRGERGGAVVSDHDPAVRITPP